jgi:hypothetical protein
MTPEEKQKADAWMLLKDGDVVTGRIHKTMGEVFERPDVCTWISGKLIGAETATMQTPFKNYFARQLERNLTLILENRIEVRVDEMLPGIVAKQLARNESETSKQLKELKKLKSKGPIHGKR